MGYSDLENVLTGFILSMTISLIISSIIVLVFYIFNSIGLYTIAKRRGHKNPWLAWIPIANDYLIGSVADDISLGKGKKTHNSIILLVTSILRGVVLSFSIQSIAGFVFAMIANAQYGIMDTSEVASYLLGMMGSLLLSSAVLIVYLIFYYISAYKIFKDYSPNNAVLFTVLSVLFGITPFFIFAIRNNQPAFASAQPPMYNQAPINQNPYNQQ